MLTPDQEKWIESMSERPISIVPYDPRIEELFGIVKEKIHTLLGPDVLVEHTGASLFGISGQDEIDVSIIVDKSEFPKYIPKLETVFGPVRSNYPDRARFEVREQGKKIDLKIVDAQHPNHLAAQKFMKYLATHTEDLERYRKLKEESDGLSTKEYYRRKTEFINDILERASA